jgi:hypothetical protein
MKTRALARTLRQLADWLDSLPDQTLDGLTLSHRSPGASSASLALNVSTLASLSRIDRSAWIDFIREHHFPIDVRPRDASRDILGKVLKFLDKEPEALVYLQRRAGSEMAASPELSRALQALLRYPG